MPAAFVMCRLAWYFFRCLDVSLLSFIMGKKTTNWRAALFFPLKIWHFSTWFVLFLKQVNCLLPLWKKSPALKLLTPPFVNAHQNKMPFLKSIISSTFHHEVPLLLWKVYISVYLLLSCLLFIFNSHWIPGECEVALAFIFSWLLLMDSLELTSWSLPVS